VVSHTSAGESRRPEEMWVVGILESERGMGVWRGMEAMATSSPICLGGREYPVKMEEGQVIHSNPAILGGTPVFVGTRVPLRNLVDYLEAGHGLDYFLEQFPTVSREQAVAALESAHEVLTRLARTA